MADGNSQKSTLHTTPRARAANIWLLTESVKKLHYVLASYLLATDEWPLDKWHLEKIPIKSN